MKKNKFLILSVFLLLITGCSSNYNLDIKDGEIKEKISFTIPEDYSGNYEDQLNYILNPENEISIFNNVEDNEEMLFYNKEILSKNGNNNITLSYTYNDKNFKANSFVETCFENSNIVVNENYYLIHASGAFSCLYDNSEIKVNITTKGVVSTSNSDYKKGDTYTWVINNNNIANVNINFSVLRPIKEESKTLSVMVVLSIVGLIIIAFLYIYKKRKKKKPIKEEHFEI